MTARQQRWTPRTFTSKVCHQASASTSQVAPSWLPIPALATSSSTGAQIGDDPLDRRAVGDVEREGAAADLAATSSTCVPRARGDRDLRRAGEFEATFVAGPAASSGDERDDARKPGRRIRLRR